MVCSEDDIRILVVGDASRALLPVVLNDLERPIQMPRRVLLAVDQHTVEASQALTSQFL